MALKSEKWADYFDDLGISPELSTEYVRFINELDKNGLPPIFEANHISLLFGIDEQILKKMVFGTKSFYRSFNLKKRSGGTRKISAPYPSLLSCQKWISKEILSKIKLKNCVTAYRKKYSIIDNARIHCSRPEILKIDIVDFFGSVSFPRVYKLFMDFGYPQNVSFILSRICTLNNSLPQGAATSPLLSNIICRKMDQMFYEIAKKNGLRYTRYSDDITFSGEQIRDGFLKYCEEILNSFGFLLNREKVIIVRNGRKKFVTGLDITGGAPRVSRDYRRAVMRDAYFVWSAGLAVHIARRRIFEPLYIDKLLGRINFWLQVEPDNSHAKKARDRIVEVRSVYNS